MEIDLERWHRLNDEIEHLRTVGGAITKQVLELGERRRRAAADLSVIENRRAGSFSNRLAAGETLEGARAKIRAANEAHSAMLARRPPGQPAMGRKPTQADLDAVWLTQKEVIDGLDREHARLAERQRALSARLNPLQLLRREIERWAQHEGMVPGTQPERRSVTFPDAPPPVEEAGEGDRLTLQARTRHQPSVAYGERR